MKLFIIKSFKFLIFITFFIVFLCSCLYYTGLYKYYVASKSIYHVIEKSKKKNASKRVLFGDSVAEQLFDPRDNKQFNINSLAASYAISPLGVYILLNNYIENNKNITDFIYVLGPFSFQNNLDLPWTYNYFLKPFYKEEYLKYFDDKSKDFIENIKYSKYSQVIPSLITNWSPEYNKQKTENNYFLSDISIIYLRKIKDLLKQNNIQFHIISPPISDHKNNMVKDLINNIPSDLTHLFRDYFSNIESLNDSLFLDNVHFRQPHILKDNFELKLNQFLIKKNNEIFK